MLSEAGGATFLRSRNKVTIADGYVTAGSANRAIQGAIAGPILCESVLRHGSARNGPPLGAP